MTRGSRFSIEDYCLWQR